MRSWRRTILCVGLAVLSSSTAFAQDEFPTNPLASRYFLYFLGAFLAIFLLLIITVIMRKVRGVRRAEMVFGMTIDDVGSLKQKGLLTEEESKAVRQALARQFARQQQVQMSGAKPTDLLADPEILRLQQLAEERRKNAATARVAPPMETVTQRETPEPILEAAAAETTLPPEDDVELPPDILTMAEMGLITAEELENIKERTRARKRPQ